ncbi:MAG: hypothetical protein AAF490_04040 [Chloroflexota bacterium]
MNKEIESGRQTASQNSSCLGKFFLTLFGIISAIIIGEVYSRITPQYAPPHSVRSISLEYQSTLFSRHAFPQMEQEKYRDPTTLYHINEQGHRGDLAQIPKPEQTLRVLVLGGSAAFDVAATEGQDWPALTEQALHANGLTQVEIINAGIPGHATFDSLGRLYAELWMLEPDYVVIYHAWNDLKYFPLLSDDQSLLRTYSPAKPVGNSPRPENLEEKLVWNPLIYYQNPLDEFLSRSQFYLRIRQGYLQSRYDTSLEGVFEEPLPQNEYPDTFGEAGPQQFDLNLRLIIDTAENIGATPLIIQQARLPLANNLEEVEEEINYFFVKMSHQGIVSGFDTTNQIIESVSEEKGIAVLNLDDITGQIEYFQDHVHTTAEGSQAIANAFAEFLEQQINPMP